MCSSLKLESVDIEKFPSSSFSCVRALRSGLSGVFGGFQVCSCINYRSVARKSRFFFFSGEFVSSVEIQSRYCRHGSLKHHSEEINQLCWESFSLRRRKTFFSPIHTHHSSSMEKFPSWIRPKTFHSSSESFLEFFCILCEFFVLLALDPPRRRWQKASTIYINFLILFAFLWLLLPFLFTFFLWRKFNRDTGKKERGENFTTQRWACKTTVTRQPKKKLVLTRSVSSVLRFWLLRWFIHFNDLPSDSMRRKWTRISFHHK